MRDEENKADGLSETFGISNPSYQASTALDKVQDTVDPVTLTRNYDPGEEKRVLRNVIIISLAFTLQFTAFNSISALQSSMNPEGLGNYANATIYGALVISCFFLPTYLISTFTVKWTLVFSVFGYCIYMAAQFAPMYETLLPTAVIVGLCAAPNCGFGFKVGHQYAGILKDNSELVIVRFFGIFFLAFQSSHIWGNIISSLVLAGKDIGDKNITVCGATFCPDDTVGGNLRKPPDTERYTLCAIFLVCALSAAAIVAFFVDPLTRYGEKERDGDASKLSGIRLFFATAKQMTVPTQILLIPLTIWSGVEQGFFAADYTQAYISCSWDLGQVGYVLICYGACDAVASIAFGPVVRKIGRVPVFIFGALVNAGVILAFFYWKPNPDTPVIFFVLAGLWGIADAIWQTQINALYGVLFSHNEESAFSNYRLWESLGFILAFVSGNTLCIYVKLYALSTILALGMAGYLTVEFLEWTKNKNKKEIR